MKKTLIITGLVLVGATALALTIPSPMKDLKLTGTAPTVSTSPLPSSTPEDALDTSTPEPTVLDSPSATRAAAPLHTPAGTSTVAPDPTPQATVAPTPTPTPAPYRLSPGICTKTLPDNMMHCNYHWSDGSKEECVYYVLTPAKQTCTRKQ